MRLADVALPVPVAHAFSYVVPDKLAARVAAGARVLCALGGRRLVGVVLDVRDADPPAGAKPLAAAIDDVPALPEDLLAFLRDLASYYLAPIGETLRLALPPVERSAARALAEPLPGEAMPLFGGTSGGVAGRRVQWVAPTDKLDVPPGDRPLGRQAAAILAHLRAAGTAPLAKLEQTWGNARAAVRRLEALELVAVESREAPEDAFFDGLAPRDAPPKLTAEQEQATGAIVHALDARRPTTFLLHGVTGSGKTEVYLRAIAATRGARRGSVMLVPEIALTPQLVARFRARFGDDVAVLHSGLTPRERLAMWKRLRSGEVDVAIGARSALFAPVRDLGLVVVDEEHDPSFKQEEGVRYHARDMAILRARRVGGVCVLGSATPSLETEHLARIGKAEKIVLASRARAQPMPKVEIVDLRRIGAGPTGDKRISLPLHRALEETLRAREQAILFLNRRGFAPSVRCEACGEMCSCADCSVALTFHKREGTLRCHYCDVTTELPSACPKCHGLALVLEGLGTERLEETLAAAFPAARVARLDRDVASGKSVEKVLARVRAREVDILVGTQMVTKGHDMPHVTLVGVINADAALSIPDFRAAERAFQLLVQVAGRAGRGDVPGRVLVQTYGPDHAAIAFGVKHDVPGFVAKELVDRRELGYPPFSRVALVRVDAPSEEAARRACAALADAARGACAAADLGDVELLGPAPAPVARVRGRYRFRLMLRSADRAHLRSVLIKTDAARSLLPRGVRSTIDVDPVQLL